MATQSRLTTELLKARVSATRAGVKIPLGSYTVQLAVVPVGTTPVTGDWHAGNWELANGDYYATLLVGPAGGAIAPTTGKYDVWVKVQDSIETPVEKAGQLIVN